MAKTNFSKIGGNNNVVLQGVKNAKIHVAQVNRNSKKKTEKSPKKQTSFDLKNPNLWITFIGFCVIGLVIYLCFRPQNQIVTNNIIAYNFYSS